MDDFHDITPRSRRTTNGTYFIRPIDEMHGKMSSKYPSSDPNATFVNRYRDYGHNQDEQGRKGHQSFYYHRHRGEWSDGATANRALMALSRKQAHAIIKDPEQGPQWQAEYERYCAAKKDQPHYTVLFTYLYAVLYQQNKTQLETDFATHNRTELITQFEEAFYTTRFRELNSIIDHHLTGPQQQQLAHQQTTAYITQRLSESVSDSNQLT